jgi:hypothetical protein
MVWAMMRRRKEKVLMGVDNVYAERNLINYYERGLKCEWHAKNYRYGAQRVNGLYWDA